jgi:ribosome biogenesis GTPase / thiamine phosphate phosphatase
LKERARRAHLPKILRRAALQRPTVDSVTDPGRGAALERLGWDEGWALAFAPLAAAGLEPARVMAVDRGAVDLAGASGDLRATLGGGVLDALAADPAAGPCSGDWAGVRAWPDGRLTAEVLLPRRTAVVRAAASGESRGQVLAANVDDVLVTVALDVEPKLGRVERLVALAWESGARPLLVLTKADLASDAEYLAADLSAVAPGVDVLVVSAVTGAGMDRLREVAQPGRTLALIGQSGVGKSTLVNALSGTDSVVVSPIGARGKGRHTTVRRELVPLPGGSLLLDTPGLRGVGVIESADGADGITKAFPEVESLAANCRFADCLHEAEPGCAVLEAVEDGTLPERRLESYRKLVKEARWIATRGDLRARAQERRKWAVITKSMRQQRVIRP